MTHKIVSIAPAILGLRGKVDRILGSAWVPPSVPISNPDDSVLVAGFAEFEKLREQSDQLERARRGKEHPAVFRQTEREIARLYARMDELFNFIYLTPAAGLIGAAIKLRMLTHYDMDIDCEDAEIEAFFDVLRVVEREARAQG
jgi:hypothetical protein